MRLILISIFTHLALSANIGLADDIQQIEDLISNSSYSEAIAVSSTALKSDPDNAAILFLKAIALQKSGNTDEAYYIYQYLTENHPNLPGPFNNLAIIYAEQENYNAAIKTLEGAFRTSPQYATAYENLKDIYDKLASDAYKIALDSKSPEVKLNLLTIDHLPENLLRSDCPQSRIKFEFR